MVRMSPMPFRPPTILSGWLLLLAAAATIGTYAVAYAPHANAHDANGRFAAVGAVETGALLFPREYHLSPGLPVRKRQAGCEPGTHPCNDIGPAGVSICCPNNQYCIVNPTNPSTAGCCAIGSRCSSPCSASQYQCSITSTLTLSAGSGPQSTSLTVLPACCPRACPGTSQFRCATTAGAGCCGYGATCAPGPAAAAADTSSSGSGGGLCIPTPDPSTLPTGDAGSASTASVAPPPGCETGQRSCPASLGGGCCAVTQACTVVDGRGYCAETPAVTDGVSVVDGDGSGVGLSGGAIAGVAVGAVVGAGLLAGVAWLAWCRRRRDGGEKEDGDGGDGGGGSFWRGRRGPAGLVGRIIGGGSTGIAGTMPGRDDLDDGATSDLASPTGRLTGLPQGYYGPDPAVGPYTDPMTPGGPRSAVSYTGGVPVLPHGPGDIAAPVEIDSRVPGQDQDHTGTPLAPPPSLASSPSPPILMPHTFGGSPPQPGDDGQVRYELYGSEVVDQTRPGEASSRSPQ
ncbi:hypothetical protein VTJ49DRAFT_6172 [Mycothermus thermophilus]|uniref:Uncharacterized protein n=1 Tax=Humicola insolens TaxID=85995 RepID=A0ABR3VKJ5_HUMIN